MEEVLMANEELDIQRKLRVLQHAEKIGNARQACRYFGIGRSSFYRWHDAYQKLGEAGLKMQYAWTGHFCLSQKGVSVI